MPQEQVDINEALGLGATQEQSEPEPVEEAQEEQQEEENQLSDMEQQAFDDGWRPKDEWKGNPDNWKSADHYVEWGDMKSQQRNMSSQLKQVQRSHNEQIENLNKFHKASTEAKLNDLQGKLNKAVEDGDTDAAAAISKEQIEIASNSNPVAQPAQSVDESELMEQWYDDNSWFFDKSDPKAGFADNAYSLASRQGLTGRERLDFVDEKVSSKYSAKPKVNHNRNGASDYSGSSGSAPRGKDKKLSMDDVTPQEMVMREVFATDAVFLKSVQNSRKGVS